MHRMETSSANTQVKIKSKFTNRACNLFRRRGSEQENVEATKKMLRILYTFVIYLCQLRLFPMDHQISPSRPRVQLRFDAVRHKVCHNQKSHDGVKPRPRHSTSDFFSDPCCKQTCQSRQLNRGGEGVHGAREAKGGKGETRDARMARGKARRTHTYGTCM